MNAKLSWALCVVMLLSSPVVNAEQPLRMRVSAAPPDIYVYVSVDPRAENRLLIVSAESEDFFGRSTRQLDGDRSARVATFHFRHLPAGSYNIEAQLVDNNGKTTGVTRYPLFLAWGKARLDANDGVTLTAANQQSRELARCSRGSAAGNDRRLVERS
jgi:hypothetical protein